MKTVSKASLILLLLFLSTNLSNAQNLTVLNDDRGYKEIKLGSDINDYNCFEKKGNPTGIASLSLALGGKDQSKIVIHNFHPNLDFPYYDIGDIKINGIEVMTYDEKIYEITLFLSPHRDILPILKYRFGNYTSFDDFVLPIYKWKTSMDIVCELLGYGIDGNIENHLLKYKDERIIKRMKQEGKEQQELDRLKKDRELKDKAKSGF